MFYKILTFLCVPAINSRTHRHHVNISITFLATDTYYRDYSQQYIEDSDIFQRIIMPTNQLAGIQANFSISLHLSLTIYKYPTK